MPPWVTGPALDDADDGDERRVEDRDREDDQRQHHRRDRRARCRPARRQPDAREPEAEQLAAGVAHEDGGVACPSRRLYGRKPTQAKPSESARTSDEVVVVRRRRRRSRSSAQATVASVAASPSMLSSRLKAFVMPTSQTTPTTTATTSFVNSSTRRPLRDHDPGGGELRQRASPRGWRPTTSSSRPATKMTRAAADDPEQLSLVGSSAPIEDGRGDAGDEAAVDPDPAERRRRRARASARRSGRRPAASRAASAGAPG